MIELFNQVLNEYGEAYRQTYSGHQLARLIRHSIPKTISDLLIDNNRYFVKGSAGSGNWTKTPWVAIFDILITKSAQSGFYPVFLFCDDMSGFYLSLNQGVTEIKNKYQREAKQVLRLKAEDFRAQLRDIPESINLTEIKLKHEHSNKSDLQSLYEAGNILAKYYSAYSLPNDEILKSDIIEILKIYEILIYNDGIPTTQAELDNDELSYSGFENLKKIRFHKRIERNSILSKKVKKVLGYQCKACEMTFFEEYGDIGKDFIEAHHLTPFSKLIGEKIKLDAKLDFVVLCSNCHSMIHKLEDTSNIEYLKSIVKKRR